MLTGKWTIDLYIIRRVDSTRFCDFNDIHEFIYIYIYILCVCVCVCARARIWCMYITCTYNACVYMCVLFVCACVCTYIHIYILHLSQTIYTTFVSHENI